MPKDSVDPRLEVARQAFIHATGEKPAATHGAKPSEKFIHQLNLRLGSGAEFEQAATDAFEETVKAKYDKSGHNVAFGQEVNFTNELHSGLSHAGTNVASTGKHR